ncbi:hypothetical protein PIB30_028654 [Stylosanthes scabra]|uniref:glucose-1-phosphate adenylyltransferase n=1 Tax=Stylosanthes scabra TaxID=79078 RepID=A0ABU6QBF1_9FABA|nr:hypothetical protein [Stylosanthes scabra]
MLLSPLLKKTGERIEIETKATVAGVAIEPERGYRLAAATVATAAVATTLTPLCKRCLLLFLLAKPCFLRLHFAEELRDDKLYSYLLLEIVERLKWWCSSVQQCAKIRQQGSNRRFNSFSLNRHLARSYNFGNGLTFGDGFVEDAKNKNIENILKLSGNHRYIMDYMDFVQVRVSDYGLMKIDQTGRIVQFAEKPKGTDLKKMHVALRWSCSSCNDFVSEIIPSVVKDHNVQAYLFNNYLKDIGTIKSSNNVFQVVICGVLEIDDSIM